MPNIGIQNPVARQLGVMENAEARHSISLAGMKLNKTNPTKLEGSSPETNLSFFQSFSNGLT